MDARQKKIILGMSVISIFAGLGTYVYFKVKNKVEAKKNKKEKS